MQATTDAARRDGRWRRLGWFAALWAASLAFWVLLAFGIRSLIGAG